MLNSAIPLTVTYNSGSDVKVATYDSDPETGLALRMLHSFFINPLIW